MIIKSTVDNNWQTHLNEHFPAPLYCARKGSELFMKNSIILSYKSAAIYYLCME